MNLGVSYRKPAGSRSEEDTGHFPHITPLSNTRAWAGRGFLHLFCDGLPTLYSETMNLNFLVILLYIFYKAIFAMSNYSFPLQLPVSLD